ncbi:hypothetical protein DAEQUDRAFT_721541 [Daedalea quercina L-15889]|uniref:Zn(2)-C6 fungal-type domain-containing protein n=1 Tax=Daedalea quercina L-15889 TaxID=1314783 RepID=A0A165TIA6_9APHY|nr:hypothetical protein DAEQUDRAFT_721541 [Daedalea quercina L-15889]
MAHMIPPHGDLSLAHSSLQSALQIDPNQQQAQQQQPPPPTSRKRRKGEGDEPAQPAEPRRLRRSHEACARCRSKKIKCDSKHPRCTACATAGTACHQEDRHRQTLTPRGHTERIERQLLQCDALLKRHVPDFHLDNLDDICAREGIHIEYNEQAAATTFQFASQQGSPSPSGPRPYPLRNEVPQPPPGGSPPRYPYPGQPMMPYGPPGPMMYPPPPGVYPPPHPHMPMQGPHPAYGQHIYPPAGPPFQHPLQPNPGLQRPPSSHDIKGQDPLSRDISDAQALVKTFGVDMEIVAGVKLPARDKEDLAVGSGGLHSKRDREIAEPRNPSQWVSVSMQRDSVTSQTVTLWLPKDRGMVQRIVEVYFTRLDFHRPVFLRVEFQQTLDALYEGRPVVNDPGYICSVYLVLALGTLSELNLRSNGMEKDALQPPTSPTASKKLMPPDWPEHEEFFERALAVKPDLRVTLSSLQALILLHWYLYTEQTGRTLWRLVGSLVRLAVELGLHHNPLFQPHVFTEEEAQLRIRLWAIVLLHDRGTSILLGRPLAIAPSDSNTPQPARSKNISEHFVLSAPLADIQADIINSLYSPTRQSADTIMRHAARIMKSMASFRSRLPDSYKWFFMNSQNMSDEQRAKIVDDITEDQGLTLLKIGITRILLLRALFSATELGYQPRFRALTDAVVTSHNIIVVHNQLIRFPDITFFVSPIPVHIAAMVMLYGQMSRCFEVPRDIVVMDVWMAVDILPKFRWRWERRDAGGDHSLIERLAEKVLKVDLHTVKPTHKSMLFWERDWDDVSMSPRTTPTTSPTVGPAYPGVNGSPGHGRVGGLPGTPVEGKQMPEVPGGLFFPFYPENQVPPGHHGPPPASAAASAGSGQEINTLLAAAAAAQPLGAYGYPASQESYMLEEKDAVTSEAAAPPNAQMWVRP